MVTTTRSVAEQWLLPDPAKQSPPFYQHWNPQCATTMPSGTPFISRARQNEWTYSILVTPWLCPSEHVSPSV